MHRLAPGTAVAGSSIALGFLVASEASHLTAVVAMLAVAALAAAAWLFRKARSLGDPSLAAATFVAQAFALALIAFSGISIGLGMKIADPFLVGAAFCAILAALSGSGTTIPRYIRVGVWCIVLSGLLSILFTDSTAADSAVLGRFAIAIGITPIVVAYAGSGSPKRLMLLVEAWLLSAVVSAAVALCDRFAHTNLSPLGGQFPGREPGLAYHPNALALACALGLPVALALALDSAGGRRLRLLAYAALLVGGILVSGSRGGLIAALVGVLVVLLRQATLRQTSWVMALCAFAILFGHHERFAAVERLLGRQGVSYYSVTNSDQERAVRLHQGIDDVLRHPVTGVGLAHLRDAHDVYLQLLSSGGVLILIGFGVFAYGLFATGVRLHTPLGVGAFAAVCAWLLAGLVENQIYDRFVYVPAGLVIAIALLERRSHAIAEQGSVKGSGAAPLRNYLSAGS